MIPLTFEDLTRATHDEVRALILEGLAEHWGHVDVSLNQDLGDMLTTYSSGRTIVAWNNRGEIVGTGTVIPRSEARAEVMRMSVRNNARRLGVGAQLVGELVATARSWGCDAVVLETSTVWTDVVAFYESCGFIATGVQDGEFGSDTWFSLSLAQT